MIIVIIVIIIIYSWSCGVYSDTQILCCVNMYLKSELKHCCYLTVTVKVLLSVIYWRPPRKRAACFTVRGGRGHGWGGVGGATDGMGWGGVGWAGHACWGLWGWWGGGVITKGHGFSEILFGIYLLH